MRVRFRGIAFATYPPNEAVYVSPSQVFLKRESEYEVPQVEALWDRIERAAKAAREDSDDE